MSNYPLTLLYDGACPVCLTEMEWLMAHNHRHLLRFVDASAPHFEASQYGTTQEELMRVIHGIRPDGSFARGIEAIRLIYAAVGHAWVATLLGLPGIRQVAPWLYLCIANNRYVLSQRFRWLITTWHGQRVCDGSKCNIAKHD